MSGPRERPENTKEEIVEERGYRNVVLEAEHVAEIDYWPVKPDADSQCACRARRQVWSCGAWNFIAS